MFRVNRTFTLKEVQRKIELDLRKSNIDLPKLESHIFLSHALKIKHRKFYTQEDYRITRREYHAIKKMVRLRKKNMPTAYITGSKEFFGRNFFVSKDTLIPRPETEELIELVLERKPQAKKVLDLGCGSGCIGITLLLEISIKNLIFSDVSKGALNVARKNAEQLLKASSINYSFVCSNLFGADELQRQLFDLIVSNPPYILPEEVNELMPEVREYEPSVALEVPCLNFFDKLLRGTYSHLAFNGWLYLEANPAKISSLAHLMEEIGFQDVSIQKDLSKKNRFIYGRK